MKRGASLRGTREDDALKDTADRQWLGVPLLTALSFLLLIMLHLGIMRHYYPSEDEFALLTHSTVLYGSMAPAEWFTRGFSEYFKVFPEWMRENYSNFMRPVVNGVYWIQGVVFQERYERYLLLNYLVHACGVGLAYALGRQYFHLPLRQSLAGSVVMFFAPAFDGNFQIYPVFCFDGMAAILSVCAMWLILQNRIRFAAALLLLAVFTKETVLWTPLAGAALVMLQRKPLRQTLQEAAVLLVPLACWFILRTLYFPHFSGNYAVNFGDIRSVLGRSLVGLLYWPSAVLKENQVFDVLYRLIGKGSPAIAAWVPAAMLFNIACYAALAAALYNSLRTADRDDRTRVAAAVIFAACNLLMIVVFKLEARFGYLLFLLLIPLGISILHAGKLRIVKPVIIALFIITTAHGMYRFSGNLFGRQYDEYVADKTYARQLIALLVEYRDRGTIYLLNDVTARYSSMESLERFSRTTSKIVKINSIVHNFSLLGGLPDGSMRVASACEASGRCVITMELPDRVRMSLQGVDERKMARETGSAFRRNAVLTYRFPEERITGYKVSDGSPQYDYGRVMRVELEKVKKGDMIIYFDHGYKASQLIAHHGARSNEARPV